MRFSAGISGSSSEMAGTNLSFVSIRTRSGGAMGFNRATASASKRLARHQRKELLWTAWRAQRPETRADPTGKNDGPAAHALPPAALVGGDIPTSSAARA